MTLPKFSFKGCYLHLSEPLFLQKLVELTCRKARSLGRRVKRKETAKEKKKVLCLIIHKMLSSWAEADMEFEHQREVSASAFFMD